MKKLFIIGLCCFFAVAVHAQGTKIVSADKVKPVENVTSDVKPIAPADEALGMKETIYDFGKIPQGKPVTHIFDVLNNGKDSLKIANVQASCGCTTPDWERDKMQAPGQKTKITVGYNAASEGPFTKFITITYNGTQSKQITIKGEVWKTPLSSAPENKELGTLKEQ